jgi:pyruvate carboxylase
VVLLLSQLFTILKQSLLATRARGYDLVKIAPQTNKAFAASYSVECWSAILPRQQQQQQ